MLRPLITLTTDFGLKDPYVAEMKAVILSICPDATIVDVSHEVEKFSIRNGAYVLASACPFFPDGSVHVAVVDPGVGTRRLPLCIETQRGFFVGPDNGVLVLAARVQGIKCVYSVANRKFMLPRVSSTFHGRDVFAPAAAHLANGVPPSELGCKVVKVFLPTFSKVVEQKDKVVGEVVQVDDFGNIVTNITEKELEQAVARKRVRIRVKKTDLTLKLGGAYGEVESGKALALVGSHGFLEISVNQGNASRAFKVKRGDKVALYRSQNQR